MINIFHKTIKRKIKGVNNKILSIKNNKEYEIKYFKNNSFIKINGSNNKIIFFTNKKTPNCFPKGLSMCIIGNNNVIKIYYSNFDNSRIEIARDNNYFTIKKQSIQPIKDAFFAVADGGTINIGEDCELGNGNLHIVVNGDYKEKHKLEIGQNVRLAKDTIIRTSDGHILIDTNTKLPLSSPQDVIIEDNVWIMSRCTILKGTHISKGSAIAANSLVNKKFLQPNILLAGSPAKIIKENILWDSRSYNEYMQEYENKHKDSI